MPLQKTGFKDLEMRELATVCFIRNRKKPDDYYLRIDNEVENIINRLNDQFEYDVELGTEFPIDESLARTAGFRIAKDAAEWFIIYLKESIATSETPEPFLKDWYEFKNIETSDIEAMYDNFRNERMLGIEEARVKELIGKQSDLFA
jgi:hypothetical protein